MATYYDPKKHHVGFVDQSGNTIGMMLALDKNGTPIYQVEDAPYIPYPTRGQSPVDQELPPIIQDDWRSGFGLEVYDNDDSKRYYSSIGMDLRFRGMAILGPKVASIAVPSQTVDAAYNVANPGFEDEIGNEWTNVTRSSTRKNEGSYSGYKQVGGYGIVYIDQSISWDDSFQSQEFTLTAYCWASDAACEFQVGIYDGVGTTWSNAITPNQAWEQATVTRTLDASASELKIRLKLDNSAYSTARDFYVDTVRLSGPSITGKPRARATFNGEEYIGMGGTLYKLNATGDGFTSVRTDFNGSLITDLEVFGDNLYIALGHDTSYFYMDTGENFTESNTDHGFKFFCTVHTSSPTLYGSDTDNTIRSTTDPTNGGTAWSAQTTVGSSYYSITKLVSHAGALWIMKEDMPYYLDSSGNVQNDAAPELSVITDSNKGKNSIFWLNKLYIHAGASLLEYDSGTNTWRSPATSCTNLGDFDGDVQALAADDEWLFAILDNSTKVEVLAGRLETVDGTTAWVWHPIQEITLAGCETAFVSSVYQKRLWIASTDSSDSLYYIPLYASYGDVTNDANRSYDTGGTAYFITPWLHGNFRTDKKAWIKLICELGHAYDADIYFAVSYQKFGDTSWTSIGDFKGTATNRVAEAYIDTTNKPSSVMMRFKFVAHTDDATKTPILKSYDARAILYPPRRNIIQCIVRCADNITDKDGVQLDADAATIAATLEEAKDDATWPVTFYDINGNTKYIRFLSVSPFSKVVRDEHSRNIERHYYLKLQEVTLT